MPREMVFFDLFEKSAANVLTGAEALAELLHSYTDVVAKVKKIKDIEHQGDKFTHETYDRLNKTFITPLDREDIHEICARLDDVLDLIDTTANRMTVYKIEQPTEDARALADCLVQSTQAVVEAVGKLRHMKSPEDVLKLCVIIHTHENNGDQLMQRALGRLFESMDPITIIKWKDVYSNLEMATDRCEDVANALESVVIKNA
ncbi:MAG: DUF47 domain-containing protein, partial [Deltaproteobacteria bacterium]|nr:DUF47 domain-containing protein [Deltaproteobacteria bacterium]